VVLRYETVARRHEEDLLRPVRFWKRWDFWKAVGGVAVFTVLLCWTVARMACSPQMTRHL
jgi:hypothetical protein